MIPDLFGEVAFGAGAESLAARWVHLNAPGFILAYFGIQMNAVAIEQK